MSLKYIPVHHECLSQEKDTHFVMNTIKSKSVDKGDKRGCDSWISLMNASSPIPRCYHITFNDVLQD